MKDPLQPFLDPGGRLAALPSKRPKRLLALAYLAGKFAPGQQYTEKEVNALLGQWHTFGDPATLRRELYDNYFLGRAPDGSAYWREEGPPAGEDGQKGELL